MKTLSSPCFVIPAPRSLASLLFAGGLLLPGVVSAATRTVTSLADSGTGSLRDTIAAAASGDTIQFGVSGTINTASRLEIIRNLTIVNANPSTLTVQRSPAAGTPKFSVFYLYHPTTHGFNTVSISGLTIQNGDAAGFFAGGAISNTSTDLTLDNCVLSNNRSEDYGGAIYNFTDYESPATLRVHGCRFSGNSTYAGSPTSNFGRGGGAICNLSNSGSLVSPEVARLEVTDCVFSSNMVTITGAGGGAAIYNFSNSLDSAAIAQIGTSTFSGNKCPSSFGGAVAGSKGELSVTDCTFANNQALKGGALNCGGGSLSVRNSCCHDNVADSGGSDVFGELGDISLVNSTLLSGAFTVNNFPTASITLTSCLVQKAVSGADSALLTIGNSIVNDNVSYSGSGSAVKSLGWNLCRGSGSGRLNATADQINTDPKLDPRGLRDNGGPTHSIVLLGDSPALDKGLKFGLTKDQRYFTRPVKQAGLPNATGGDGTDIGPVEMTDRIQGGAFIQVTTLDDHDDGSPGLVDCTLREAIGLANGSPFGISISFAPGLSGTITLKPTLGVLYLSGSVAITGPGARTLTVSGNDATRVFEVYGDALLSGMTVRNGRPVNDSKGGAIDNHGSLTVRDCAFSGCQLTAIAVRGEGVAGIAAQGGAIANAGTLRLERCSFSGNSVKGGTGADNSGFGTRGGVGGGGLGGAVFNDAAGHLIAEICTFYGNTGTGGEGGYNPDFAGGNGGAGRGGVYNEGTMTLTSCTFSGNTGTGGAGGVGNNTVNDGHPGSAGGALAGTGASTVRNTVSAGNTGGTTPDAVGTFTSGGFNLIGKNNGSTGFTAAGDRTGTNTTPLNALLGAFQNNGGQTDSMLPGAGSPTLDGGNSFGLPFDQRSYARRFDSPALANASGSDGTDMGAIESGGSNSSAFRIISFERHGGFFSLLIRGSNISYFRYQLQRSHSLTDSFINVGAARQADSTGLIQFIDASPDSSRGFYRVIESF